MARKLDPDKYEAKRQQILEAAIACFAQHGFHQTSTAQICAEVGMSSGNLFHYFGSKEAIIEAIVEEDRRETSELFARIAEAEDLFAGLLELVETSLALAMNPIYARIGMEIGAEAMRNPRIARVFARSESELKANLVALLRKAAERRQIDATLDLEQAATWIIVLADGAVGRAALDPSFKAVDHSPILRTLVTRFLRPHQPE